MRTMIDISHWQDDKRGNPPDLALAEANAVDAFLFKAGRGIGTTSRYDIDPSYLAFARQAELLGVPFGAYWWPEPNESSPMEQADVFLSCIHATNASFLDVDVESFRGPALLPIQTAGWLRTFIDELVHAANLPIVIYTRANVWGPIARAGIPFFDCDLRVAQFLPVGPPARATTWTAWIAGRQPNPVDGWPTWSAWQFSAAGNRLGRAMGLESDDVDCNVITEDAWRRWFG